MGVGKDEGQVHWLPSLALGVEGGLGVRIHIFSGIEGIQASRAEHQCLKDVGEGHHAQKMLGLIH